MKLFPAIDLKDGQVVRLTMGDYGRVERYGGTPAGFAQSYEADGAHYLHVVDLDGAKDGTLANFSTVRSIVESCGMFVEVGGGIRNADRVRQYLELGVGRVILGTAALEEPDFLQDMLGRYGDKIAVGVDARDGKVATGGWLHTSSTDGVEFCRQLRDLGVDTVIYTDISRDGAMRGTNLDIYRTLCAIGGIRIVASGGISSEEEISALRAIGCDGAIIGKALYEKKLDLKRLLRLAKGEQA